MAKGKSAKPPRRGKPWVTCKDCSITSIVPVLWIHNGLYWILCTTCKDQAWHPTKEEQAP